MAFATRWKWFSVETSIPVPCMIVKLKLVLKVNEANVWIHMYIYTRRVVYIWVREITKEANPKYVNIFNETFQRCLSSCFVQPHLANAKIRRFYWLILLMSFAFIWKKKVMHFSKKKVKVFTRQLRRWNTHLVIRKHWLLFCLLLSKKENNTFLFYCSDLRSVVRDIVCA